MLAKEKSKEKNQKATKDVMPRSIKILCTSDYHRSEIVARKIPEICKKEKVDLLVNTGDFQSEAYANDFLGNLKIKTFVVPGNWDPGMKFDSKYVKCHFEGIEEFAGYTFLFASEDGFHTDELLLEKVKDIPSEKLVLLSHYPPKGILDMIWDGRRVGFDGLRQFVDKKKPLLHAFGHIHEDNGQQKLNGTLFVNGALGGSRKCYLVTLPEQTVKTIVV